MTDPAAALTIGALAESAGVGVETIRYYQRRGLMRAPAKPARSIRRYGPEHVDRLLFIKAAQRLGFDLDGVAQMLALEDGTQCAQARQLAVRYLAEVRRRLADLRAMETQLGELVQRCGRTRGRVGCPLIASLRRGGDQAGA